MSMKQRSPLAIAFFTIFLDLLGFGIMIPVQPFYAEHFGASATWVTILGASFSLMQFLFAPFWGRLSDRVGRRPIILGSVAVSVVGHLLFAVAENLPGLFLARMLAGFGNANLATAQAIVSDTTGPESRAKGMGMIGAAFGLGFILGPAIGGTLSQWGPTVPSYAAAVLGAMNWVSAFFLLPETLRAKNQTGRRFFSIRALREALARPAIAPLLLVTFFATFGFAMIEQVMPLLVEATWVKDLGLVGSEATSQAALLTAYFLIVVGVTAVIMQGFLIGRLSKRFREVSLIQVGLSFLGLGVLLMPAMAGTGSYVAFVSIAVLTAAGNGMYVPTVSSAISKKVGAHEQGGILGLNQSLASLGRVFGPACAGFLFELTRSAPFVTCFVFMMGAVVLAARLRRKPA